MPHAMRQRPCDNAHATTAQPSLAPAPPPSGADCPWISGYTTATNPLDIQPAAAPEANATVAGAPDAAPGEGTSLAPAPAPAPEVAYGGEGDSRAVPGRRPLNHTRLGWKEVAELPIRTPPTGGGGTHVHAGVTAPPKLAPSMPSAPCHSMPLHALSLAPLRRCLRRRLGPAWHHADHPHPEWRHHCRVPGAVLQPLQQGRRLPRERRALRCAALCCAVLCRGVLHYAVPG